MKKNIWILNHYATDTYFDKGGRHYWFAKYLKRAGYNPVIFCANTVHGFDTEIDTKGKKCILKKDEVNGFPFVFIKVPSYKGNGIRRIRNMIEFYRKLFPVTKLYSRKYGYPDIIFASSVHPLTLVAGIKIAKKMGVKCICEVRDLWPESIVAYGKLKKDSLIAKILYRGEKWIYKRADALIFTMEGGKDYIINKGWDRSEKHGVELQKIHYINNGMDLEEIEIQRKMEIYDNPVFRNIKGGKIIYTGSIREANDVGKILDAAKHLMDLDVTFCIFGDGDQREKLEERLKNESISNVIFFGKVEKKYIASIVSDALLLLLLYSQDIFDIAKYGMSQNKLFDYLAGGHAIISNLPNAYSIINEYNCGIEREIQTGKELAQNIRKALEDGDRLKEWGAHAAVAAKAFSFEEHTKKLISIIESL